MNLTLAPIHSHGGKMSQVPRHVLLIPVRITEQSYLELAIAIFAVWSEKNEGKKQYGFYQTNETSGSFFLVSPKPVTPYALRAILARLEHIANLEIQNQDALVSGIT